MEICVNNQEKIKYVKMQKLDFVFLILKALNDVVFRADLPKGVIISWFELQDDALYFRSRRSNTLKLVIPRENVYAILKEFHDSPNTGHPGADSIKKFSTITVLLL